MANAIKELAVDIKIYKTSGAQNIRRSRLTEVQVIATPGPSQNQARQQNLSTRGRRRGRHYN